MNGQVKHLYSKRVQVYQGFVWLFRYSQGVQAALGSSGLLRSRLRVLDAGCGTGLATFAFLRALHRRKLSFETLHAFDLTPAMLARFQRKLAAEGQLNVHLLEADVLDLNRQLPPEWMGYDLILSSGMLEYVPRTELARALASLRGRLAHGGSLLLFITGQSWITRWLIGRVWKARGYAPRQLYRAFRTAGFASIAFQRFPWPYFWLNDWGYIIVGSNRGK